MTASTTNAVLRLARAGPPPRCGATCARSSTCCCASPVPASLLAAVPCVPAARPAAVPRPCRPPSSLRCPVCPLLDLRPCLARLVPAHLVVLYLLSSFLYL